MKMVKYEVQEARQLSVHLEKIVSHQTLVVISKPGQLQTIIAVERYNTLPPP